MKSFSGFTRGVGRQTTQTGVLYLALVLGAAMFAAGCGKEKSAGPAPSAPPPTNQAAVPPVSPGSAENSQPVPAAPAVNADTNSAPMLQDLNRALIGYIVRNHYRPKTFEEFVAKANIQIPPPPAGKKYTFNKKGYIILVDR